MILFYYGVCCWFGGAFVFGKRLSILWVSKRDTKSNPSTQGQSSFLKRFNFTYYDVLV